MDAVIDLLIKAMEKAPAPDRGLDERLSVLVGWRRQAGTGWPLSPEGGTDMTGPPAYTARFEAALGLFPVRSLDQKNCLEMHFYSPDLDENDEPLPFDRAEARVGRVTGSARTLALAVCIVAVKLIASQTGGTT